MRGAATLVGLLIVVGAGYVVYQNAATQGSVGHAPPQEQIDLIGVRADLLAIGAAEAMYLVEHGSYATLEELVASDMLTGGTERRGYTFAVAVNGSRGYAVTARPSQADRMGWPTLEMDETRRIVER